MLEGLGSDSPRWGSATVSSVVTTVDTTSGPRIFAAFNVLKSEFLVARRLAFTGISMIEESGFQHHPEDTGLNATEYTVLLRKPRHPGISAVTWPQAALVLGRSG